MEFKKQVERKKKLIEKHQAELSALLKTCPHDEIEKKDYYYDGSYLDKAHTERWEECVICHKKFNHSSETHSWYG